MYYIYRQNHLVKIVLGDTETEGFTRYATESESKELVAENYNCKFVKDLSEATKPESDGLVAENKKVTKKVKNDTNSNTNRDSN